MKSLAIAAGILALTAGQAMAGPSQLSESQLDNVVAGSNAGNGGGSFSNREFSLSQVGIGNMNGHGNANYIASGNDVGNGNNVAIGSGNRTVSNLLSGNRFSSERNSTSNVTRTSRVTTFR